MSVEGVVEHEYPQRLGVGRRAVPLHHLLRGIEQQLQCRQALLAVDDMPRGDVADLTLGLIDDDRSEEVRRRLLCSEARRDLQQLLGDPANVLPQRVPLVLLVPHIRTLEQRDHVPDVVPEDVRRCERLCLHLMVPLEPGRIRSWFQMRDPLE